MSNKSKHYILDNGDFNASAIFVINYIEVESVTNNTPNIRLFLEPYYNAQWNESP